MILQRKFFRSIAISAILVLSPLSREAPCAENPVFSYTHLLPSPYTLRAGRFVIGTDTALGLTDFLQIGTNVVLDIYQTYNAQAKLSLLDFPEFALALTGGWLNYNYANYSVNNPNIQVTSWLPGAVTAFGVFPYFALFVGGNLNFTKAILTPGVIDTSGYIRGAGAEMDMSWAYNPHRNSIGNVLSAGVTYDFSYQLFGVGVSHHWKGFHLGIHYYPNAQTYRVLPIIAGSMGVDI